MRTAHLFRAVIMAIASAGCSTTVQPVPVQPVYTEVYSAPAPVDIEAYPYVVYGGRPHYYYQNRWWYREGPGWTYYPANGEPEYLRRQRPYVQHAPPAYPYRRAPVRPEERRR
jgi:hypothetical protein